MARPARTKRSAIAANRATGSQGQVAAYWSDRATTSGTGYWAWTLPSHDKSCSTRRSELNWTRPTWSARKSATTLESDHAATSDTRGAVKVASSNSGLHGQW